jgi:hypothetical protein
MTDRWKVPLLSLTPRDYLGEKLTYSSDKFVQELICQQGILLRCYPNVIYYENTAFFPVRENQLKKYIN